jgi:hypothetical protein
LALLIIQGFPGAYSEAAAKKAYPNCQTVPCEHFDTAFQVTYWDPIIWVVLVYLCMLFCGVNEVHFEVV